MDKKEKNWIEKIMMRIVKRALLRDEENAITHSYEGYCDLEIVGS